MLIFTGPGTGIDVTATNYPAVLLEDLALIGPGTGTPVGLDIGTAASPSVQDVLRNVGIFNFATCLRLTNTNEVRAYALVIRGCTTGISAATAPNDSQFYGLEVQSATTGVSVNGATVWGIWGGVIQNCTATGIVLTDTNNATLQGIHFENAGVTNYDIRLETTGSAAYNSILNNRISSGANGGVLVNGGTGAYFRQNRLLAGKFDIAAAATNTILFFNNISGATYTNNSASTSRFGDATTNAVNVWNYSGAIGSGNLLLEPGLTLPTGQGAFRLKDSGGTAREALYIDTSTLKVGGGGITNVTFNPTAITLQTLTTVNVGANTIIGAVADKLNAAHLAIASQAIGDVLTADSTTSFARIADVAAGSYFRSGGIGASPVWSTLTLPNAATTGDLLTATGSNAVGVVADVATGQVLTSGGVGAVPAYSATPTLTDVILTGQLKAADGTAAAPGISFSSQLGFGWWRTAASTLSLVDGAPNAAEARVYNTCTGANCGTTAEYLELGFKQVANTAIIRTVNAGGSARNLQFRYGSSTSSAILIPTSAATAMDFGPLGTLGGSVAANGIFRFGSSATSAATSGTHITTNITGGANPSSTSTMVHYPLQIAPTINYSAGTPGAGSYEALKIAVTETALPTGTNYLIRASAGSGGTTDKFTVLNTGTTTITGPNDAAVLTLTGGSVTGSGTTVLHPVTGTFNTTGVVPGLIQANLTNTASGAGSRTLELQRGGTLQFGVTTGATSTGTQIRTAQQTAPTCSSNCGTSPSVSGSDTFMTVTMGSSGVPASGWVVTFNGTWATAPACAVFPALAGMVVGKTAIVVATTTTTVTVTTNGTAPANSDKYHVICGGIS